MVSPVSNDKILPQTAERPAQNRARGEQVGQQKTSPPENDSVKLSQSGQLANQEADGPRRGGNITSAEQARSLVSKIREQLEGDGTTANAAHGRMESGLLTNLLQANSA